MIVEVMGNKTSLPLFIKRIKEYGRRNRDN